MARPRKWRRVCQMPDQTAFGPQNGTNDKAEIVRLTIDEYETVRLIDHQNMTQEECALRMDVARTTVQKIYNDARFKLAKALVEGLTLIIEGGDYQLCNGKSQYCHSVYCHRHSMKERRVNYE